MARMPANAGADGGLAFWWTCRGRRTTVISERMTAPIDSPSSAVAGEPTSAAAGIGPAPPAKPSLVRNTLYLTIGQAATVPIAVITNALLGRYLGPEEFGHSYLAATLCGFAILALEWGQQGAVPALVARDRSKAGVFLGTSLLWRATMAVVLSGLLALLCELLGYSSALKWALALSFPSAVLISCGAGFKDTMRGFERTDVPALAHVAQQVLGLLLIFPVLLLGGRLRAVLLASMVVAATILIVLRYALRSLGVPRLSFDRNALKALFAIGTPFVFFDLAMVLLPNINATFLSKLVPDQVIGWYGVSQRLVGLLIFPASALIGALYPTLCRLQTEDRAEFNRVSRDSLYGTALLAVPAAVGCAMFAELGVAIFDSSKFGGSIAHLRVMSAFVFLVYFSMPLGTTILAANRQRAWALVQCVCILFSVAGNPFLIPYFQKLLGNGAIGTCVMLVASEGVVVGFGIALAPRGIFNAQLMKSLALSALSGAAMAAVAWVTKPVSLFLAVPAALITYAAVAWFSGAVQPATATKLKGFVRRKWRRA
jgi:O-antigen/teichoic acid export membrane protein